MTNENLLTHTFAGLKLDDAIKEGKFNLDFVKNLLSQTDFKVGGSQLSLFGVEKNNYPL